MNENPYQPPKGIESESTVPRMTRWQRSCSHFLVATALLLTLAMVLVVVVIPTDEGRLELRREFPPRDDTWVLCAVMGLLASACSLMAYWLRHPAVEAPKR